MKFLTPCLNHFISGYLLLCRPHQVDLLSVFIWYFVVNTGADSGFPVGGGANPPGSSTYNFAKLSEKLHKIEKVLGMGTRAGDAPLDPPLEYE